MERFNEPLLIPGPEAGSAEAPVRVPLLGAYVLNKANTFHSRSGPDGRVKSGEDLLYLRDIMAAGRGPNRVLQEDLAAMLGSEAGDRVRTELARAHNHLKLVAARYHGDAAEILAERDALDVPGAEADVEGHLRDLADMLGEFSHPD